MHFSSTVLEAAELIVSGRNVRAKKDLPQQLIRGMLKAWKAMSAANYPLARRVAGVVLAGITDLQARENRGALRFTVPKLARSVAYVIERANGSVPRGISERSMARHLAALRDDGYLQPTTLSFTKRGDAYSFTRWSGHVLADWFGHKAKSSKNKDIWTLPLPNMAVISDGPHTNEEAKERSVPGPVDNHKPKPQVVTPSVSPGRELHAIASATGMTKGQLGHVLTLCKAQECRLQDVYRAVGRYLHKLQLQGGRAFMYLKSCIESNPGRDWTWEARRDAQKRKEDALVDQERQAFSRFMEKIQRGEPLQVKSVRTGETLTLRQRDEAPEFLLVLGEHGQIMGTMPARRAFETYSELRDLRS